MKGCASHWDQAIWRMCKCKTSGCVAPTYHDNATHLYVKKLMALQLLPAEHIDPVFQVLKTKATSSKLQHNTTTYIEDTLINSSVWPYKLVSLWTNSAHQQRSGGVAYPYQHIYQTTDRTIPTCREITPRSNRYTPDNQTFVRKEN